MHCVCVCVREREHECMQMREQRSDIINNFCMVYAANKIKAQQHVGACIEYLYRRRFEQGSSHGPSLCLLYCASPRGCPRRLSYRRPPW